MSESAERQVTEALGLFFANGLSTSAHEARVERSGLRWLVTVAHFQNGDVATAGPFWLRSTARRRARQLVIDLDRVIP